MLSEEQIDEIKLLIQFDLSSSQSGLKIHSNALPAYVSAAKRLFEKGLVDHRDGGYLTSLGRETAEHLQFAYNVIKSSPESVERE